MTYTLLKFLGWGILLAVIGGCVGWALRSLIARRDVARARVADVEPDEEERMRHRLADLEQVVAERDRLRMQIADMRHTDSPGVVGAERLEPRDDAGSDGAEEPGDEEVVRPQGDDGAAGQDDARHGVDG